MTDPTFFAITRWVVTICGGGAAIALLASIYLMNRGRK